MLFPISGGRGDGTPWPAVGETLVVDTAEGAQLVAAGLAVPVVEERAAETPEDRLQVSEEQRGKALPKRAAKPQG